MEFEPISTYKKSYPDSIILENFKNIIRALNIKSWCQLPKGVYKISMIERILDKGTTLQRIYDFGILDYSIIQHAAICQCVDGTTFILTMPDVNKATFYFEFNQFIEEYNEQKRYERQHPTNQRNDWIEQLNKETDMCALVINNTYKPRQDGKIIAVIGTKKTIDEIESKIR